MSKHKFTDHRFSETSILLIEQANGFIEDYQEQGYTLTLRQLYYRFVAKDLLENTTRSYKRLGSLINDARLAGLVDWSAIEDRTRSLRSFNAWRSPAAIIQSVTYQYRRDTWADQPCRVEVWVEKEALVEVVEQAADHWDVPTFPCRGYMSQSAVYESYTRFDGYRRRGQDVVIIHLGDHDPSGVDMTRDNRDRLNDVFGVEVEVDRIALNMDQVREYDPPPNPAKVTDSRAAAYIEEHGPESWELDALEPSTLDTMVQDAIRKRVDMARLQEHRNAVEAERHVLNMVAENWQEIAEEWGS